MDQHRFDAIARMAGAGGSRRSLLGALAGLALAAVGLGDAGASAKRSVGNSCKLNADCASGRCVQETRTRKICHCVSAADCPAAAANDVCHSAACLPNGYCGFSVNLGTACNDGLACTTGDICRTDGSCQGTPVVCTASDQCHEAGSCDPATGLCSNPPAADGTACSDGNACTKGDTCQGGSCVGGTAVVCTALDQCHVAGTCDPSSGTCSNPNAANGTACTPTGGGSGTCQGGTCYPPCSPPCGAGEGCCAGACIALDTVDNCGACGNVCGACGGALSGVCYADIDGINHFCGGGGSCSTCASDSDCSPGSRCISRQNCANHTACQTACSPAG